VNKETNGLTITISEKIEADNTYKHIEVYMPYIFANWKPSTFIEILKMFTKINYDRSFPYPTTREEFVKEVFTN